MRPSYDHDYPPAEWTVAELAETIDPAATVDLPTYEEADAWADLRADPATRPTVTALVEHAEATRDDPVPPLPVSRYLDYTRTGNRTRYEDAARDRRTRLSVFALAECFEREGRYLDAVLDHAWAICEQSTWTWPAHLGDEEREGLPGVVDDEERTVALFSVGAALLLSEVAYVLGDRLHPALRERIRSEVDRRVLTPYEARNHGWMDPPASNWNAVCNAGVAVSALHVLDDPERQARIVNRAVRSLQHYLGSFDEDGCTGEGIGYWNYGFGNYVTLAAALEAVTDGAYSLASPPVVDRIAAYPLKTELSPGRFTPFSDTEERSAVAPRAASWLGTRLDRPGLAARGRWELSRRSDPFAGPNVTTLPEVLRDLAWTHKVPSEWGLPTPSRREYFGGFGWWTSRVDPSDPDGLVVTAKAGHNAESHNHNDCGSFIVHHRGESLLTDLGRPTYDRDFFGDQRYEYLTARSLGHSVPYVNGCEQAAGESYRATVVDRTASSAEDSFVVELSGCYPAEAGLDSLRREVTLYRDDRTVEVTDAATFADEMSGNAFESVLVSYLPIEPVGGEIVVRGENGHARVTPTEARAPVKVEHLDDAVDVFEREGVDHRDVWRARFTPKIASGEVSFGFRVECGPTQ